MRYITGFLHFWYDFIVGDDWTIAAAVVLTLVLLAALAQAQLAAWWLLPAVVVGILGVSLLRVAGGR